MAERARWSLSLVLPAYNEAAVIQHAIREADDALALLAADYEVLVVDDGSTDDTARLVLQAMREHPRVRLLSHPRNRGYSAALRTGFEAARFDRVAFTDADCQFDLADLGRLVPLTDRVPLAVGYRVDRQDPWSRRLLSRGFNLLARTLLGTRVRDIDCALKVFRRDALLTLLPETPGFFVNTEMLTRARLQGYAIEEVGVRHRPRLHGTSKVSRADVPRILRTLVPFWWARVLAPRLRMLRTTPAPRPVVSYQRVRVAVPGEGTRLKEGGTHRLPSSIPSSSGSSALSSSQSTSEPTLT